MKGKRRWRPSYEKKTDFAQKNHPSIITKICRNLNPIAGKVPFNATYELIAKKAGDDLITIDVIKDNIKRYTKGEFIRFEEKKFGALLIIYPDIMDIDLGNEVHLEIKSSPLNG